MANIVLHLALLNSAAATAATEAVNKLATIIILV